MGMIYYSCAINFHLIIMILLIMEFAICSSFSNNTTTFSCIAREKKALLKLKASFTDPSNRLSSWNNTTESDCCAWQGVTCDKITRHVISLRLGAHPFSSENMTISCNQLDSSLSELKYLSHLDVSGNDFQQSPIPTFLGSMKQLQHLNLSNAGFSGVVPHNLGNLSSLRVLDLNYGYQLMVDDLKWASNLSRLENLDLSHVDLSRTKHLSEVIVNMLSSILVLCLSETQLDNTHLPHACVNSSLHTNIQHLDLSRNSFEGELPYFLHNMTSLRVLDLSESQYNFSSPHALIRLRNLVHLDLKENSLHHSADWNYEFLSDKCHLKSLFLGFNHLRGDISGVLKHLSVGCKSHKLETLDLSGNDFYGHLPVEFGEFNQLNFLDLSNNNLSGEIPVSLGKLSNLKVIEISFNSFNGTLSEAHFAQLSKLEYLVAGYNNFINFSVGFDWVPPFQLKSLSISSCRIGGDQFPQWLQTQKLLTYLDMSNCSILGPLPEWFHYLNSTFVDLSNNHITGRIPKPPPYLESLDLSHNRIEGSIPKLPPFLKSLDLSHNHIEGSLPKFGYELSDLDLSDNMMNGSIPNSLCKLKDLYHLDLSKNHFSGDIPNCLVTLQSLTALRLSSNELSGVTPNSFGEANPLLFLSLSNNSLTGQLPSTLRKCTSLEVLDVGQNMLSGDLPGWIGTHLNSLKFLRLRENEFNGVIPSALCRLLDLQVIDLANNKLTGNIPHSFGNFSGMKKDYDISTLMENNSPSSVSALPPNEYLNQMMKGMELEYTTTILEYLINLDLSSNNLIGRIPWELTNLSTLIGLNLSHNHLEGNIPTNIGGLKSLESFDLSSNNLSGPIPHSLSDLNFLTFLNLSHNNLSGPIPTGHQLQTLDDPAIYDGNLGLCGSPLPKKCADYDPWKSSNIDGAEDEEDRNEKIIFYGVIASGFATGFWGIIGVLVLKRTWRIAFFEFAQVVIGKIIGM